jgi:hypothetical protein
VKRGPRLRVGALSLCEALSSRVRCTGFEEELGAGRGTRPGPSDGVPPRPPPRTPRNEASRGVLSWRGDVEDRNERPPGRLLRARGGPGRKVTLRTVQGRSCGVC